MYVKLRPYLEEFLEDMLRDYELVVYTSAEQEYADEVLDFIETKRQYFAHRLYYPQCIVREEHYAFKDLELLCYNRSIRSIFIVDNIVRNYSLYLRNGIPIVDYDGSKDDVQLVYLATYLKRLAREENPQKCIKADLVNFCLGTHK